MEFEPLATSAPSTLAQNQSTRNQVRKPMHFSTAHFGLLSPTVSLQSSPNDVKQPIIDATSVPTLPILTRLQISWGKCGIPRSPKLRQFLEKMAEEVVIREGFQYATIL